MHLKKLNAATVSVKKPIPLKDVIIDGIAKSTNFSSMDYHILVRERKISYRTVNDPKRYTLVIDSDVKSSK